MNTQKKQKEQKEQKNGSSKGIFLTETNLIDILRKLKNDESYDSQEIEDVRKRFYELLNYDPGKGSNTK